MYATLHSLCLILKELQNGGKKILASFCERIWVHIQKRVTTRIHFFWHSPMGKRRVYIQNIIFMLMPCILPCMLDRKKWFVPSCHPFLTSCHFLGGVLEQNKSNKSQETDAVDGVISKPVLLSMSSKEKILVLEVKKVSAFSSLDIFLATSNGVFMVFVSFITTLL